MADVRSTSAYQRARRDWLKRQPMVCHWCGRAVSDHLKAGHPNKATADHLIEVDRAEGVALNTRLWVVACWGCNSRRGSRYWHDGAGAEPDGLGSLSRDW